MNKQSCSKINLRDKFVYVMSIFRMEYVIENISRTIIPSIFCLLL